MSKEFPAIGRAALLAGLVASGCLEFRGVGPDQAPPEHPPKVVDVTIEYRQPNGCQNAPSSCDDPVVFFGTWMRPGAEFPLTRDPQTFTYRGTALAVPVNFPPHDNEFPYQVRVFDPHLRSSSTLGMTALRIKLGGESLVNFANLGTPEEHANVFVDADSFGRNP
jgi:hypothetical protein